MNDIEYVVVLGDTAKSTSIGITPHLYDITGAEDEDEEH